MINNPDIINLLLFVGCILGGMTAWQHVIDSNLPKVILRATLFYHLFQHVFAVTGTFKICRGNTTHMRAFSHATVTEDVSF